MDSVSDHEETYEHVSILEFTEEAAEYGYQPGELYLVGGVRRNTHVRDDEEEGFVKIADAVAIIELHQELAESEVNNWCNSPAGKLALAHWFDHVDPDEVVHT